MPMDSDKALWVIQQQLKDLDVIYQDTMEGSLNTVHGFRVQARRSSC